MVLTEDTFAQRLQRLSIGCAVFAAALAVLALVGWIGGVPRLTDFADGLAKMKFNTAVGLLACAGAMMLRISPTRNRTRDLLADALAVVALAIGTLTLLEYALGRNLGLDQLFPDPTIPPHGHAGRMSIATALATAVLAASNLLLDRNARLSRVAMTLSGLIATLGLLGYIYGIQGLYRTMPFSSMALNTAITLALITTAHIAARPRKLLSYLFLQPTIGALLIRRLMPAMIIVPLVLGWLRLRLQLTGYINQEFGVAMMALVSIVVLGLLIWWNATQLDRSDFDRRRLEVDRDQLLGREQTARARAEKALLARDQLLAIVSHELRTPLTPALLTATALEHRANLPADVQEDIRLIQDQIQIEARLIDDLLDMASLNQSKVVLKPQPMDLHEVIRSLETAFGKQIRDPAVHLHVDLRSQSPRLIGDPLRLRQVIGNLLNNAMKFSPDGGIIRLRTYDAPGDYLAVQITDSGVGIEPAALQRIFHTFEQGDPSTTRRFGGLGVGLTISKALVDLHRGSLTAASDGPGQGATFTLELPRGLPTSEAGRTGPAMPTILLVDDNSVTLAAMKRVISARGYHLLTANSAKDALDAARAQPIDLLVSDISLPDLSGWELMRQMREIRPIRGIAVSGFTDAEDRAKSLSCGFSAHLGKPLDMHQLLIAIETVTAPLPSPKAHAALAK